MTRQTHGNAAVQWHVFDMLTSGWHWRCEDAAGKTLRYSDSYVTRKECIADAKRHGWPDRFVKDPAPSSA